MIAGTAHTAGWRRAVAGALLMLFGCSHVPTEPTRGTPPRGKQEGPLPGVPEEQPWVEANVPPPPYPKESDLVEFHLRGQTSNRFFIDTSSLTVGPDRVVRFALVIRVPEGTENATFSGLRCSDRDWKDYAYGRSDHTWSIEQAPEWRRIQDLKFNDYKGTLYHDYMCAGGVSSVAPVGDAAKLVRLLKNPPPKDDRNPTMPKL
ncbi:MAG TPA: CNP1-like family protein [Burkholderiales bacterium]|nr:CNP1-like family protein [Burkholderiales bacterium]